MMKKVLALVLAFVMVLTLVPVAAYADETSAIISVDVAQETKVNAGEAFDFPVKIENNPGYCTIGLEYQVYYGDKIVTDKFTHVAGEWVTKGAAAPLMLTPGLVADIGGTNVSSDVTLNGILWTMQLTPSRDLLNGTYSIKMELSAGNDGKPLASNFSDSKFNNHPVTFPVANFTLEGGLDPSKLVPTITKQPVGATYTYQAGGVTPAALTVAATAAGTATGGVTYQWYSNTTNSTAGGTAIDNATTASYSPEELTTFGTTYYYCVVSNVVDGETHSATSDVAAVTYNKGVISSIDTTTKEYTYTGQPQGPDTYTVKDAQGNTVNTSEYTLSGNAKQTNAGEYTTTVTANATGNYTGTASVTWNIAKANYTIAGSKTATVYFYTGAPDVAIGSDVLSVTDAAGNAVTSGITYTSSDTSKVTIVDGKLHPVAVTEAGQPVKVTATIVGDDNHNSATAEIDVTVSSKMDVSSDVTFTVNGEATRTYGPAVAVSTYVNEATFNGTAQGTGSIVYRLDGDVVELNGNVKLTAGKHTFTATYEDDMQIGTKSVEITVNKKSVAATVTAADKVYDGTTTATVTAEVPAGDVEAGDAITISGLMGTFENANAGIGKKVAVITTDATITGTGSENYVVSYSDNVTANITAKAFSDSTTIAAIADQAYTGSAITPEPEVKDGDAVLVKGHDYNLTYENNENAGTATVKVTGTGNYSGEKTATFTITAKALESVAISSSETDGSVKAGSTLTAKVLPVVTADDVTYQWFVGTEEIADATTETFEVPAGTADGTMVKVVVKGDGNYSGTVEAEVETGKIALGSATVTIAQDANLVYTGSAVEPAFTVTINGTEVAAANYTATFSNNVNAGTASIILTAANDAYSGTATATFEIAPAPITGAIVAAASDQNLAYNGRAQVVNVAVTLNDKALVMGTDFTVTDNIVETVGEHELTVTVTGKGNYTGTISDAHITVTVAKGTPTGTPAYTTINTSGKTLADAALAIGSITPAGGTIKWVDAEGNALADTTEVTANTQYSWLYTPVDPNYDTLRGTVTLWTQGGSSGGSTGGGGGGGSSTGGSTTTTNPDGSTTTTKTDKTTGTVTETTKYPDGSTTVVETKKDGSSQTKVDKKDGSTSTTTVDTKGQVVADVKLSDKAVKDAGEAAVALPMPEVSATADNKTAPTVTVNLPSGSKDVKVEIPVKNVTPGTVAILVKADGTEEIVKTSVITANGVAVKLNNGDTVKIVDNSKKFTDVPDSHWGKDAIAFASSHELFNGTSETTFSPDEPMTRGMLMTVLARFDGANTEGGDPWYQKGMEWAVANGVSDGTNPEANLTREQMITMIWRYTGSPASEGSIDSFADASSVSDWAQDAMKWAVSTGLVKGTGDNALSPKDGATRAMVATLFMRYVELMAK